MPRSLLNVCCRIPLVLTATVPGAISLQSTLSKARITFEFLLHLREVD